MSLFYCAVKKKNKSGRRALNNGKKGSLGELPYEKQRIRKCQGIRQKASSEESIFRFQMALIRPQVGISGLYIDNKSQM